MTTAMTTNNYAGLVRVICSLTVLITGLKNIFSFAAFAVRGRNAEQIVTSPNHNLIAYKNLSIPYRNLDVPHIKLVSIYKNLISSCRNFYNPLRLIFTSKNLITTCKLIAHAMSFIFFNAPGKYRFVRLRNDAGLRVLYIKNNSRTLIIRS
jgi:hypothetical protein